MPYYEASLLKVLSTEFQTRFYNEALQALGSSGLVKRGSPGEVLNGDIERSLKSSTVLLFGGGSNDVQRDIIATHGLGLAAIAMLFADSETQKLLRDTARSFLAGPLLRGTASTRSNGARRSYRRATSRSSRTSAGSGSSRRSPRAAAGASLLEAAVVVEELGYAGVPAPVASTNLAAYALASSESPEARPSPARPDRRHAAVHDRGGEPLDR